MCKRLVPIHKAISLTSQFTQKLVTKHHCLFCGLSVHFKNEIATTTNIHKNRNHVQYSLTTQTTKQKLSSRKMEENKNTTTTSNESKKSSIPNTGSSNMNPKAMAQYNDDARLMHEFEQTGETGKSFFNYTRPVSHTPNDSQEQITAYLSRIQRGGMIQPFGCLIAIEGLTFKIIAFSENCYEMLGLKNQQDLLGTDARTLFTNSSKASLMKAVSAKEISFLNPVWVRSRTSHKPFYAILHRIDVGTVIDLEPAHSNDPAMLCAGAVQSQKLAVRVITKLQSLPGGDIGILCDTLVENVQKLTGYDRVMVYKFHDDNHGEVVAEIRKSELEPYLGLHYPATDIPQAARFLFKQNRIRIICDCNSQHVKIVQSEELKQPLCLVNSTLRAPHSCHNQYMVNMGSIASLAMAVVVNNGESTKLWGLVVCHHTSPRHVPFPLRYACEFLMQAFGLQMSMELQLASQLAEKKSLQMQTLLCDMLLRESPSAIVTQSPSLMDLVKCDGAALYYRGKSWLIGVTPTESQLKEIVEWLIDTSAGSSGFSTDSLAEAGYPMAAHLGDAVCGMAAARISVSDFLFWFRSHTAKEIKWGGAKHHPEVKDDGHKMNPRSSFSAFLEVIKNRSQPWEDVEINAIHSLQLILRESFELGEMGPKTMMIDSQQYDCESSEFNELTSAAAEMVRLIDTATVPIFGVDLSAVVNGWNGKMYELTGLKASEAIGKSLIADIVHEDSREVVETILHRSLQGDEDKNVKLKLMNFGPHAPSTVTHLVVNTCISRDCKHDLVGVCFVGQDVTSEKNVMDKLTRIERDYKAIIHSINPLIPPIFASDVNACCSEWSAAMEKLTGWTRDEIIGKVLPGGVFGSLCQLKSQDELTKFMILLYRAISGQETEKLRFGFFNRKGEFVEVFLTASKRTDKGGNVIGCFCFLQRVEIVKEKCSVDKEEEKEEVLKVKELAYIRHEMKNPLNGIRFTHQLLNDSSVTAYQKQFLETSYACERQILSVIDDTNFGRLEDGSKVELKMEEFLLGNVVSAIVSQAMISLNEKNLRLVHDIPEQMKNLYLHGDQMKLQSSLSSFLLCVVKHTPSPDGWVEIKISPSLRVIQNGNECAHLQLRMTHPGQGIPSAIIEDMFSAENNCTEDGIVLNLSQRLLNMMNGNVAYIREQNKCCFLIDLELKSVNSRQEHSSSLYISSQV